MSGAALGLGVVSILIALASLVWSIYQGRRSAKALEREELRREEEIALLRSQVERQVRDQREDQAAVLVGRSTGFSGSGSGVDFPVSVRNIGKAVARDITVWLALAGPEPDDAPRPAVSTTHELDALVPGDPPAKFTLTQPAPFPGGKVQRDGVIVASWTDGNGDHIHVIGKLIVFV